MWFENCGEYRDLFLPNADNDAHAQDFPLNEADYIYIAEDGKRVEIIPMTLSASFEQRLLNCVAFAAVPIPDYPNKEVP